MEVFLDCLPCVLRQVLEASRMATGKNEQHAQIMEEALKILANYKDYQNSPDIVKDMHQVVKRLTGVSDPYKAVKERDIKAAQKAYPLLRRFVRDKQNSLYWVLKMAATGNIMDSAIYDNLNFVDSLQNELTKEFSICDLDMLQKTLSSATNILIIGDNAGETVFDRVLIEHLAGYAITYAVREEPVINDATLQDAYASGLGECAVIMTTGCSAPGAIMDQCSADFLRVFNKADIVISKGQGNYETLSECHRSIFFLLKAKCAVIADRLGVELNSYVCQYHSMQMV